MDFPRVCNINTPILQATVQATILVYPNRKKVKNYRSETTVQHQFCQLLRNTNKISFKSYQLKNKPAYYYFALQVLLGQVDLSYYDDVYHPKMSKTNDSNYSQTKPLKHECLDIPIINTVFKFQSISCTRVQKTSIAAEVYPSSI